MRPSFPSFVISIPLLMGAPALAQTSSELRDQYEAIAETHGEASTPALESLYALSGALISEGDYLGAEVVARELLDLFEREFGHDHPNTGYALDLIATSLREQGRNAEALQLGVTALDRIEGHFGPTHEMTLVRAKNLAILYGEMGRYDEGIAILDRYRRGLDAAPELQVSLLSTQAFLLLGAGRPEEALHKLDALLALYRTNGQEHTGGYASQRFHYAQVLVELDRKPEAYEVLDDASRLALDTYGPDHPRTRDILELRERLAEELDSH